MTIEIWMYLNIKIGNHYWNMIVIKYKNRQSLLKYDCLLSNIKLDTHYLKMIFFIN
jgi:hypothetical protein